MNSKQIAFLKEFKKEMRTSKNDSFLIESRYKNGNNVLSIHDIPIEKWTDLAALDDSDDLWEEADKYLKKH